MAADKKTAVNFADCYVLTDKRTKGFILSFLDTFLPDRQEYTGTYEVPQFSEQPAIVFTAAVELIGYLEQHPNERHAIYWYNREDLTLRGAMCLFTSDGQVIIGVFCESLYPDTVNEDYYLKSLLSFCNSVHGLIEYATPAARDTAEFMKRVVAFNNGK